ncbi:MAG TPA: hypothetical protein VJ965_04240 [Anaerolineales bacterium]|nr:hypothetical protein [Anaerolineales bacterium]
MLRSAAVGYVHYNVSFRRKPESSPLFYLLGKEFSCTIMSLNFPYGQEELWLYWIPA